MPDDPSKTGHDRKEISVKEEYEVRDWTRHFGVTEARLREAVEAVGHSAARVGEYFGGSGG